MIRRLRAPTGRRQAALRGEVLLLAGRERFPNPSRPGGRIRRALCPCCVRGPTTVLFNAKRGSEQYQSTNSSIAWRYPLCASRELRLLKTADLACSRSSKRRMDFVVRLLLEVAVCFMIDGLHAIDQSSERFEVGRFRFARDSTRIQGNSTSCCDFYRSAAG